MTCTKKYVKNLLCLGLHQFSIIFPEFIQLQYFAVQEVILLFNGLHRFLDNNRYSKMDHKCNQINFKLCSKMISFTQDREKLTVHYTINYNQRNQKAYHKMHLLTKYNSMWPNNRMSNQMNFLNHLIHTYDVTK